MNNALRLRGAALVCVVFVAAGCTGPRISAARLASGAFIDGGSPEQRADVFRAVRDEPMTERRELFAIHLTDGCPGFSKDDLGRWEESAHCHWWTRIICVHPADCDNPVVWHESGHALFFAIPAYMRADWEAISRDAYGDRSGQFPRNGILTEYGAKDYYEGFAEWVCWTRCYLTRTTSPDCVVHLRYVDRQDARYIRSLRFLRDAGAITPEEYDKLEPLFTPLCK